MGRMKEYPAGKTGKGIDQEDSGLNLKNRSVGDRARAMAKCQLAGNVTPKLWNFVI